MTIKLGKVPSTDGLGVKRWTYPLDGAHTLHVYERPQSYLIGRTRFMLRLDRGMEHVGTDYRATKIEAARHARHIHHDICDIGEDEPYMLITRATHERGIRQTLALAEMDRRGLWLSKKQRQQAQLWDLVEK